MRHSAVAKFNREQSLHAMWQAFCARSFSDQQLVEHDAFVVLALLNARYYESARGQFISQDPVFWEIGLSQDGKRALSNPQALNSYGYASDNPVTNKDPDGRWAATVNVWGVSGEVGLGPYVYAGLNVGISFGRDSRTGEWWLAPTVSGS